MQEEEKDISPDSSSPPQNTRQSGEFDQDYYEANPEEFRAALLKVIGMLGESIDYKGNVEDGIQISRLKVKKCLKEYFPGKYNISSQILLAGVTRMYC